MIKKHIFPKMPALAVALLITAAAAHAEDCKVAITVANMSQTETIPEQTLDFLTNRLRSIVSSNGAVTGENDTRFFISGRFNHSMDEVLPGPPKQYAVRSELTVFVGDSESQTLFGSCTLDLRGIGNSKQKALINSMNQVNGSNKKIVSLISKASEKIIDYYDANTTQILTKAQKAAEVQNYDEALYYAFSIPECCKSYPLALAAGLAYYKQYINVSGRKLYEQARAAWITHPDANGASTALDALLRIPVGSTAYPDAEKLAKEIEATIKDDKKFEQRTKYNDAVELEKMQIASAKEIGVAWGKGQQPKTTNITWIK